MTKTEIKHDILTDAELDGVVGGFEPAAAAPRTAAGEHPFFATRESFNRF